MNGNHVNGSDLSFFQRFWLRVKRSFLGFWRGPGGDLIKQSWRLLIQEVAPMVISALLEQATAEAVRLEKRYPSGSGKGSVKWKALRASISAAAVKAGFKLAARAVDLIAAQAVNSEPVQAIKKTALAEPVVPAGGK